MKYAISDVHGKYELFLKLLEKIKFSNTDTLYILGDVVDGIKDNLRNPKDVEIFQYIMKEPNIHLILGNHEYELLEYLNDNFIPSKQKYTFTDKVKIYMQDKSNIEVLSDYLYVDFLRYIILETDELRKIHLFLKKLPYYILIDGYILCHGGFEVPYDNIKIEDVLKYQEKEKVVWPRNELYKNKNRIENTKIIFGHTNVKSIDSNCTGIWKNEENDKIGIDTSCFEIPTIACINLDNLSEIIVQ